jgi:hypothetical protein
MLLLTRGKHPREISIFPDSSLTLPVKPSAEMLY